MAEKISRVKNWKAYSRLFACRFFDEKMQSKEEKVVENE